ncbi:hypothetical protein [Melissococcus plutonius]|uniref:hypothetical protein n=1 Tax=Melissococcus plutonius TaxID=33970 RepID=UPI00136489B0|nr:hypothetical protein [Melissococcus plutonius]
MIRENQCSILIGQIDTFLSRLSVFEYSALLSKKETTSYMIGKRIKKQLGTVR